MPQNSQQIARFLQQLLRATRGKIGTKWAIALLVLVGGYLFAEPALESKFGVDLPGVHSPASAVATDTPTSTPPRAREPKLPASSQPTAREQSSNNSTTNASGDQLEDVLEEIGRDTYRTDAGLIYGRGSIDGHRLKHLMTHAADEPDRPGQHGVFDETDPAKLIQLVDEAYLQALTGKNTRKQTEEGRTVYTVDLGRRVGYIGGESGGRRNHPPARHMRLVLDGERFITAFPLRP
jgi:hypothetical protein